MRGGMGGWFGAVGGGVWAGGGSVAGGPGRTRGSTMGGPGMHNGRVIGDAAAGMGKGARGDVGTPRGAAAARRGRRAAG
jgi:hypothetical protein